MYSVLLAAMLTTGGQATTWHHGQSGSGYAFGWCHGCTGGCGGCYGSWGSYSSGCHGCWGGNYSTYSSGRYGSCYGSSCYGSSCYGSSCYGSSCYGSSCYGSSCYGCYGNAPVAVYSGCSGCYGGGVIYTPPMNQIPPPKKEFNPPPPKEKEKEKEKDVVQANVARITVNLPASAKLWVDNAECPLTSASRSFNTPTLQPGRQYYYTLTVQLNEGGAPVTENRRVYVSAGKQVNVDFSGMATASR